MAAAVSYFLSLSHALLCEIKSFRPLVAGIFDPTSFILHCWIHQHQFSTVLDPKRKYLSFPIGPWIRLKHRTSKIARIVLPMHSPTCTVCILSSCTILLICVIAPCIPLRWSRLICEIRSRFFRVWWSRTSSSTDCIIFRTVTVSHLVFPGNDNTYLEERPDILMQRFHLCVLLTPLWGPDNWISVHGLSTQTKLSLSLSFPLSM